MYRLRNPHSFAIPAEGGGWASDFRTETRVFTTYPKALNPKLHGWEGGSRTYYSPLDKAPLRTGTGRGNDPRFGIWSHQKLPDLQPWLNKGTTRGNMVKLKHKQLDNILC